ncbi:hypothetical protein V8C37DRAFT_48778 [Trichoderma ceciliae]
MMMLMLMLSAAIDWAQQMLRKRNRKAGDPLRTVAGLPVICRIGEDQVVGEAGLRLHRDFSGRRAATSSAWTTSIHRATRNLTSPRGPGSLFSVFSACSRQCLLPWNTKQRALELELSQRVGRSDCEDALLILYPPFSSHLISGTRALSPLHVLFFLFLFFPPSWIPLLYAP